MTDSKQLTDLRLPLTRRRFLHRTLATGATVAGASALLTACKKEGASSTPSSGGANKKDNCDDLSALSPEESERRQAGIKNYGYVEKSPEAGKFCDNCQLYNNPKGGELGGGCKIIPGPVQPKGYCKSWARKTT